MTSEQVSTECDQILNKYGYNKAMADRRITENNKISQSITMMTHQMLGHSKVDKVLVGSRREGISLFGESDTDVMIILNDVLAREGSKSRTSIQKPAIPNTEQNDLMSGDRENDETKKSKDDAAIELKTVFVMDQNETPAGYTLLRASSANNNEYTCNAMVKTQRGAFLSSQSFLLANKYKFRLHQGWMKSAVRYKAQNGPSLPETLPANDLYLKILEFLTGPNYASSEKDCVISIPCHCPSLLHKWQNRKRPYDWPTPEMIEQVVSLPVHVVPVGLKGSRNQSLQWRISFTFAEIHLVQNLNDTQIKVLVLLRNFVKERLTPISNKISSYVIKNVMFWLSESIPLRAFNTANLLERFKDGLLCLQENIRRKHLPCYMLPQRNLLQILNKNEVKRLVSMLDCIIHNEFEMLDLILNERMKKVGLEKLAAIDKMSLEVYKEMTAHDIFTITNESTKCTTSYIHHMRYAYLLLKPHLKKRRLRTLRENCRFLFEWLLDVIKACLIIVPFTFPRGAIHLCSGDQSKVPLVFVIIIFLLCISADGSIGTFSKYAIYLFTVAIVVLAIVIGYKEIRNERAQKKTLTIVIDSVVLMLLLQSATQQTFTALTVRNLSSIFLVMLILPLVDGFADVIAR